MHNLASALSGKTRRSKASAVGRTNSLVRYHKPVCDRKSDHLGTGIYCSAIRSHTGAVISMMTVWLSGFGRCVRSVLTAVPFKGSFLRGLEERWTVTVTMSVRSFVTVLFLDESTGKRCSGKMAGSVVVEECMNSVKMC